MEEKKKLKNLNKKEKFDFIYDKYTDLMNSAYIINIGLTCDIGIQAEFSNEIVKMFDFTVDKINGFLYWKGYIEVEEGIQPISLEITLT